MSASVSRSSALVLAAGAAAVAAAAAALIVHVLPCPWPLKSRSKNVYVLAVFLTIKPGTLTLFKERFAPLARRTRSTEEPNCLSYELCVNPEDDTDLLIYERYVSKDDLTGPHQSGAEFKAFGKWLNEESGILVSKSRKVYTESEIFRPGACTRSLPRACRLHPHHLFLPSSANVGHMIR